MEQNIQNSPEHTIEQDIQHTVQYINEVYNENFENEDSLEDILYHYLTSGNESFIDGVFDKLLSEQGLFFMTIAKEMASIKGYVIGGNPVVSHLYAIPFIATQDKENTKNTISQSDIEKIEAIFDKHGISEKYDVTIFDTMLTPYGVPKEPIEINDAHDSIIFNSLSVPDMKLFSRGVSSFNKTVKEDEKFFNVDNLTFVIRYMMISVKEADVEDEGEEISLTEFVDSIDSDSFCEDLHGILGKYYQDILMAFSPIPYIDGVEIGIIEYNAMMALHLFMPFIETLGTERLDVVLDHSEIGSLKVMLVDKTVNKIVSDYNWAVPILLDSSVRHNIHYLQDFCKEIGFDGYSIVDNENPPKKVMH